MKKFEQLGRKLSKGEQKKISGGADPVDGGSCGTICYNCAALSVRCNGHCLSTSAGVYCDNNYYPCPSGNFCGL